MIQQAILDDYWDFDDASASERRFRAAASASTDPAEAAEYLTQVARALGLQDRFDEAAAVLAGIGADRSVVGPEVAVRVALERGRIENSAGRPEDAIPHFRTAADLAATHRLEFLRIDALHMLAIADQEHADQWTAEGIRTAEAATDARTQRWNVALYNNQGWSRYDAGDLEGAVESFERALDWADRVGTATQQRLAREALEEARATASHDDGAPE